jgi:hypothetical protein
VKSDGTILDEQGRPFSKMGIRQAILNDLSPAATFIANNYNNNLNFECYGEQSSQIINSLEAKFGWMYRTLHTPTQKMLDDALAFINEKDSRDLSSQMATGTVNYTIWSEVFICSQCADEVVFWESAVNKEKGTVRESFPCPHCQSQQTKRGMERAFVTKIDPALKTTIKQAKIVPVLINYSFGGKRYKKIPDLVDIALLTKIESLQFETWFPSGRLPEGTETRRNDPFGITHFHHFYTPRNLHVLSSAWANFPPQHRWILTGCLHRGSKQHQVAITRIGGEKEGEGGATAGHRRGTLYIPSNQVEVNVVTLLRDRADAVSKAVFSMKTSSGAIGATQSMSSLSLPDSSLDYFFLDPPFGSNIDYSELNSTTEAWLRVFTDNKSDAIEDRAQGKDINVYRSLISSCFNNAFKALKPGRWITVEFSNTQASIWNVIQTTIQEAGFVIANVSVLSKGRGGLMSIVGPTAVKQDLVISAYKPNGGLESRFAKKAQTEEGVWEFIRTHLGNLPVARPRGGQLEPIAERDPRILFDRTVAFYVRHGIPVPISSPEFQAGLAEKFPERDGMYFMSEQAAEYDKVRMKMEGIGQLILFVEDERSAVAWLRNYLKNKPCKYNDIQPEFFEQLNQSWKKWETRPELRALLDQYFLCYSGEGDVPPQIHSYLSTNFKELRNLPSDHAMLRAKARDRWFVPDPRKNADVEQLREKRLLEEFWAYMPPGYEPAARRKKLQTVLPGMEQMAPKIVKGKRIAIVRTEAIRVGFNFCFAQNDYQTIIAVARYIPESVIQNDEQLQMIYDSAMTRTGGEFE